MFATHSSGDTPRSSAAPFLTEEQREILHIVNRLRLEFRMASTLELEAAVVEARKIAASDTREKILSTARKLLGENET